MKQALAWLIPVVAAFGVDPARAASPSTGLTDVFIRFCGDTRGDADRALQLADAEGWSVPPKGMTVPSFGPPVYWVARQGRWTQAQGVRRVLTVGTIRDPDGKDTLECTVGENIPPGMKADLAAMQSALRAWVGGGPLRTDGGFAEFAYRESNGERTPLLSSEDPLANGAPRTPPEVARVTLFDLLEGTFCTIMYGRSAG